MGSLKLTTASSGSVILSPANTASDVTITVPAVTGTMLTNKTAGTVLQVVSTTKTDTFSTSTTAGTYVDITGLSVSITPSSSSSKILVMFALGACGTNTTQDVLFRLNRNSTVIANGDSATYTSTVAIRSLNAELTCTPTMFYLDSPSTTSSTTYKVSGSTSNNGTLVVNKRQSDTAFNAVSTITVMEIAA